VIDSATRRSDWLFLRQGGRCFLGITKACIAADRMMGPIQASKCGDDRGWTWEHVIPSSFLEVMNLNLGVSLKLLACRSCNTRKGSRLPDDEHVDLAMRLSREWFTLTGDRDRGGAVGAEIITNLEHLVSAYRECAEVYGDREPLRPERAKRVRGISYVCVNDDLDVPQTVEEALAQGGIRVSR
jgi:hypothetical protein